MLNVALIGMPSSGKSTVGRALAEKLGKKFIDLDEEIVKADGRSIPDIFAAEGEDGFRARRNLPRPPALPKRADSCSPAAAASSSGARICGRCIRTASCSSSTGPWMR